MKNKDLLTASAQNEVSCPSRLTVFFSMGRGFFFFRGRRATATCWSGGVGAVVVPLSEWNE